jgi:hypothetical protein
MDSKKFKAEFSRDYAIDHANMLGSQVNKIADNIENIDYDSSNKVNKSKIRQLIT